MNYFSEDLTTNRLCSYVPTLLRVGGYMQSSEVTTNNGVAMFFNGLNIVLGDSTVNSSMPLNPTECGSSIATGMTCRTFRARTV